MLGTPIKAGKLTLKNRIVFPPVTTGYEEADGTPGDRSVNFYRRIAEGGTGYIVIGDVAPVNTASPTPKLDGDEKIGAFRRLAGECHAYGAKVGVQIFHPEYDVVGVGELIMRSRMLRMEGKADECEAVTRQAYAKLHHDMENFVNEATKEQLAAIAKAIADCAVRAEKAGMDAVQIHGDRLIGALCSPILNRRTDGYGETLINRVRFAIEVVRAVREAVPEMTIDYKLPVITPAEDGMRGKGGLPTEEATIFASILESEGVDMLHVAQANHTGNMNDTIPAMGTRAYGFASDFAAEIKKAVKIPVCAVGRIVTVAAAEALLAEGKCDLVGIGRGLVCDPDFAKKAESGGNIRHCINCNKGCTDAVMKNSACECVLNAENGAEYRKVITKATTGKKVAVVGAGIAGLEAARVAAEKGHFVTVYEKTPEMGGQINIASAPPRKEEMLRALDYYKREILRLGIRLAMCTKPSAAELNAYDVVIVATGAENVLPKIKGCDSPFVVGAWDVLSGRETLFGRVVVIGGGLVGAETAEYLAVRGCDVTVVEQLPDIAKGESATVLPSIMADFAKQGVKLCPGHMVTSIESGTVMCEKTESGGPVSIPADFVVMAVGAKPAAFDTDEITAKVLYAGDCVEPSNISSAVRSAYDVANSID
ncbi:MAG: NAD(P)/FAD-dependent oxidoreductase [Clostridia bacterium]|nr:NAD(P)/FAD-dependent oxidoreductase [Clostridia bacterium]